MYSKWIWPFLNNKKPNPFKVLSEWWRQEDTKIALFRNNLFEKKLLHFICNWINMLHNLAFQVLEINFFRKTSRHLKLISPTLFSRLLERDIPGWSQKKNLKKKSISKNLIDRGSRQNISEHSTQVYRNFCR